MPLAVRVVPSTGSTATSTDGPETGADLLAVVKHRRFVLLPLADHHDASHRDRGNDLAHGIYRCSVGAILVPAADPETRRDGRGFGDPNQLHGQVAVGRRIDVGRRLQGHGASSNESWRRHHLPVPARSRARSVTDPRAWCGRRTSLSRGPRSPRTPAGSGNRRSRQQARRARTARALARNCCPRTPARPARFGWRQAPHRLCAARDRP